MKTIKYLYLAQIKAHNQMVIARVPTNSCVMIVTLKKEEKNLNLVSIDEIYNLKKI
jgi:hypothetical protein